MRTESPNTELMMRYLLGELSDKEQGELEQEYFEDPGLFNELRVVRDDLIDAYVRDELSPALRLRFEKSFHSLPERRERVEFAEALRQAVESRRPAVVPEPEKGRRWQFLTGFLSGVPRPAFALAALIVLGLGSWLAFVLVRDSQRRLPSPTDDGAQGRVATLPSPAQPSGSPQAVRGPEQPQTPSPGAVSSGSLIASFVLSSDLVRGTRETERLAIPKGATVIQLKLILESDSHKSYRAEIRTPEGASIWTSNRVQAQSDRTGNFVSVSFPATLLTNADYIVRLSGVTTNKETVNAGSYYFRASLR